MMENISRKITVCETCNTSPRKQADGVIRCEYPGKLWYRYQPNPGPADAQTAALLKQKGFDLAGCGWYYYGSDSTLITVFKDDDTWVLENAETPIADLKEYLVSLPDRQSPTET